MSARESIGEQGKKKRPQAPQQESKRTKVVDVKLSSKRSKPVAAKSKASPAVQTKTAVETKPGVKSIAGKIEKSAAAKSHAANTAKQVVSAADVPEELAENLMQAFTKFRAASKRHKVKAAPRVSTANFLFKYPAKGKRYKLDLRIHTPGTIGYFQSGGIEPGPALVRLAKVKGLNVIGLTDFCNASFLDSVQNAAASDPDLSIIPCLDLCCSVGPCKDLCVTALFPESYRSADLFRILDELGVPKEARGRADYCLPNNFGEIVNVVERNGGVLLPTRIDKTPYRQLAINTLVDEYKFHAFDLVHQDSLDFFKQRWPAGQFVFFTFSNASSLAQIGTRLSKVRMLQPGFAGIKELIQRRVE